MLPLIGHVALAVRPGHGGVGGAGGAGTGVGTGRVILWLEGVVRPSNPGKPDAVTVYSIPR